MRKVVFIIFAMLLFAAPSYAQDSDNYPLRLTGYTIPDNPYRTLQSEGAVWPSHEYHMTLEQQLDFSLLTGAAIPLTTVKHLARPVVICRDEFGCFETGLLTATELIVWENTPSVTFGDFPAIIVYKNMLFTDFYMIAVFSTFELGEDGNPHPEGFWWVRIDEFDAVFTEMNAE